MRFAFLKNMKIKENFWVGFLPDCNDAKRSGTNNASSLDWKLLQRFGKNIVEGFRLLVSLVQEEIVNDGLDQSLRDWAYARLCHLCDQTCVDHFSAQKSSVPGFKIEMNTVFIKGVDLQKISSENSVVKLTSWVEYFQKSCFFSKRSRWLVTKLDQVLKISNKKPISLH